MPPQTPFEQTGEWTTYQEEQDFLAQIVAETNADHQVAGESAEGRNIDLITLGDGDGSPFLTVAGQHGNEPAAREAALINLRDWAYSEDSRLDDYRLAWVPTANPDGASNDTRENSNGVDPNRDHFDLSEAEAQAINAAMRATDPVVIADLHESSGTIANMWLAGSNEPYIHMDVRELTLTMLHEAVVQLAQDGETVRRYVSSSRGALRQQASMRHAVGLLTETSHTGDPAQQRVDNQLSALNRWQELFFSRHGDLTDAKTASIARANESDQAGVHALAGNSTITESHMRSVWADGYDLSQPIPESHIEAFGITVHGSFVPMRQWARSFLPLLLDSESTTRIVSGAERVGDRAPSGPPVHSAGTGIYLQVGDTRRKVTSAWIQGDNSRHQIG